MRILNHYLKHYAPLHWMILLKCNVLNFTIHLFKVNCHHFLTHFLLKKLPSIITKLAVEMISTFKPHIHQLLKIVLGTIFQNYCLSYQLGLQKKSTT